MIPAPTNKIPLTYGALQILYCIVLYCIIWGLINLLISIINQTLQIGQKLLFFVNGSRNKKWSVNVFHQVSYKNNQRINQLI